MMTQVIMGLCRKWDPSFVSYALTCAAAKCNTYIAVTTNRSSHGNALPLHQTCMLFLYSKPFLIKKYRETKDRILVKSFKPRRDA